jgi:hypothetical protein
MPAGENEAGDMLEGEAGEAEAAVMLEGETGGTEAGAMSEGGAGETARLVIPAAVIQEFQVSGSLSRMYAATQTNSTSKTRKYLMVKWCRLQVGSKGEKRAPHSPIFAFLLRANTIVKRSNENLPSRLGLRPRVPVTSPRQAVNHSLRAQGRNI